MTTPVGIEVPNFDLSLLPPLVTNLDILGNEAREGKVRHIMEADAASLVLAATDRASAFDVVLNEGIPGKGTVLNRISLFWHAKLHELLGVDSFRYHLISSVVGSYPVQFRPFAIELQGRSMLVRKLRILPIEAIVRGYLAGSGWKEYQKSQTVCGIPLPAGLIESDKLPEAIFTPSTKAEQGDHDINIAEGTAVEVVMGWLKDQDLNLDPVGLVRKVKKLSLLLYSTAVEYARSRGIIIADTKFEWGLDEQDNLVLGDEILTPDSSRFWWLHKYQPGRAQTSLDKQLIRDYLELLCTYGLWDKTAPAPELPTSIVNATTRMYLTAYWLLTGKELMAA